MRKSYCMLKGLFIFILGMMCSQSARAQKQDTLLYFMKNSGKFVTKKDSADYFLFIMPQDSVTRLYPIIEYYPNGKPKLRGASTTNIYDEILFSGPCVNYFSNGHRKSVRSYEKGDFSGDASFYYPNGKLYSTRHYNSESKLLLIDCRDSTGNLLAENGNGRWIKFDENVKHKIEEGLVKDSLEEGEWHEIVNDSAKYIRNYRKGVIESSTDPRSSIDQGLFVKVEKEPHFKGGAAGLNAYLAKTVEFPAVDRKNGTQGKVIVTFVVEKNGTLTNIKALRGPSQSIMDAAVQAIQRSPPWIPGMQGDRPVRVQYTISFSFNLTN